MRVLAEFPDGDVLSLTVERELRMKNMSGDNFLGWVDIYFFKEKNLATWWYKDLCIKI